MVKFLSKNSPVFVLFFILSLNACKQAKPLNKTNPVQSTTIQESSKSINQVLMSQQSDWNRGDIPAFMKGYWKSEELIFVGRSGIKRGWDTTLKNYINSYPDLATMGKLEFEVLALDSLSNDLYRMVGNYTLIRAEDKPSGIFTLIWKRINGQWKIISDHTTG